MSRDALSNETVNTFWQMYKKFVTIRKSPHGIPNRSLIRERFLAKILDFVKAAPPDARMALAACFVKLVREFARELHDYNSDVAYGWVIIPFCMHELQWPEVRVAIELELKVANDPEIIRYLKRIRSAYEPVWEDESSFLYYEEKAEREGRKLKGQS